MLSYHHSKKKLLVFFYFLALLFAGLIIYDDYGISLDEDNTRINGFVSLKYIFSLFYENYIYLIDSIISVPTMNEWQEQGIGVVFDLPTALIELLFKIDDSRNYYLLRHLINFFIFYSSLYFFYLIIKKKYKSILFALLGTSLIFFTPRIFAQSFFNNKDIIFMSLFIINLYTAINFLEKTNIKNSILFSLTSALAIDIRILGIMLPILIISLLLFCIFRDKKNLKIYVFPTITFIFFLPIFIYIFWPFLWENPVFNFLSAFKILSNHDVNIYNFYLGEYVYAKNLPWHYSIVWILITTPFLYTLFFLIGSSSILFRLYKRLIKIEDNKIYNDFWRGRLELNDLIFLLTFAIPIFAVIFLNSTLYDGWRHLYFIYPSFILITLQGIYIIKIYYIKKNKIFNILIISILIFPNLFWMVKNHPYQNVYFNFLAGKKFNEKFEMDYWGLSNHEALKYISKNENKPVKIKILSTSDVSLSKNFLDKEMRENIIIVTDHNEATYLINNYRDWSGKTLTSNLEIPENYDVIYNIKVDDVPINTIYKKNE